MEVLTIQDQVYTIQSYLGDDLKFSAIVCGIESATAVHAYVWCKCSKSQWPDMQLQWSISDPSKGARTVREIMEKCKQTRIGKIANTHHFFLLFLSTE